MAKKDRTDNRKIREQRKQFKVPELGYYLIVICIRIILVMKCLIQRTRLLPHFMGLVLFGKRSILKELLLRQKMTMIIT